MPLGANYRLIDIPVSNCINSGEGGYKIGSIDDGGGGEFLSSRSGKRKKKLTSLLLLVLSISPLSLLLENDGKTYSSTTGVNKVYTLTQFNSASLNRHLAQAYNVNVGGYRSRGFVEVLAASQSVESKV